MTYDPNSPNSLNDPQYDRMRGNPSSYGWTIGGILALAVVIGVLVMLPHRTDNAAVNGQPTSKSATTGSGATSPAPSPGTPATPR